MADLSIIPYKFKSFPLVKKLLELNNYEGVEFVTHKSLPKIGYLVLNEANGIIACGFLRKIEGGYAQLDTYATNPYAHPNVRNEAINLITDTLMADAKNHKLSAVLLLTSASSIAKRAEERGFKVLDQKVLGIKL